MRNYVYTDLSVKNSLILTIDGKDYDIVQFTASWAANEIPTAACMVSIGRNARTGAVAAIHSANKHRQMVKATVSFFPRGAYDEIRPWPKERQVIFDGYYCGFAYRKVNGKVQVIISLLHWLAALGFSSALTKAGHVSNPTSMNAAAILASLGGTGSGLGCYVSQLVPGEIIATKVKTDLWDGIKSVFCGLASAPLADTAPEGACRGSGSPGRNDFAVAALSRMEGPGKGLRGDCSKAYRWGVPLALDTLGLSEIEDAVSIGLGTEMVTCYANTTFWDKLVNQFCPLYGMAVVPMVDSAIVVADTPALSQVHWKEVTANDYDSFDMSAELTRPLRGVGVISLWTSQTGGGEKAATDKEARVGGCYMEDSASAGDGTVMYVAAPSWLTNLKTLPGPSGDTSGMPKNKPGRTATTPGPTMPRPSATGTDATELYGRFAHSVYVNHMLRGRGGAASGKLRFDMAPLSIVRLSGTTEKFIGAEDDLASSQYACVQRVTVSINAESAMAGTTLALSHLRSEVENDQPRTSVSEHPLFGKAIHGSGKHGSPLVDAYNIG